jgi:serpin B
MIIMLPRPGQTLNAICQTTLQAAPWSKLLARLRPQEGQLALPRCKIISQENLADVLSQLGMSTAFASGQADFSALSASGCSLSQVKHTIALELNESGDRSSTPLERRLLAPNASIPPAPFTMIANRPFLFAYLSEDGAVLLLGAVTAPEWRDVRRVKDEE